jgi:hypothetical protein
VVQPKGRGSGKIVRIWVCAFPAQIAMHPRSRLRSRLNCHGSNVRSRLVPPLGPPPSPRSTVQIGLPRADSAESDYRYDLWNRALSPLPAMPLSRARISRAVLNVAAKLNNSPTIEITEAAFDHIVTVNLR